MRIIQTYANKLNSRKTVVERQISCVINWTPTTTAGTPQGILYFNRVKHHSCAVSQHHSSAAAPHHTGTGLKHHICTIIQKKLLKNKL